MVLSHGYGTNQSVWHYILPALALYYKVLVYDLAFVGPTRLYNPVKYSSFSSYARDLTCLLDELNLKETIFVGHSMSAMIGCIAATKRPDLFHHLVLLNGSPRYLNGTKYNGGFTRAQLDETFESIRRNYTKWVEHFAPEAIGVDDTNALEEFESSLLRLQPRVSLDVAMNVFLKDNRHFLPFVRVGSTIIQSKRDIIVPITVPFYMKRKLGGSTDVRILNTSGHFPQLSLPYSLVRVIKEALGINGRY
ncbi:Probable esterase KAI2 [Striga hermonthica]|uniref:Probable esterase KAI2 n=1 Tax=Striga hermonthica TaxID=68872 RepID=A0A9N7NWE3_STRHE|nr:Probable esterase KAI2 [Striga hermonthica]